MFFCDKKATGRRQEGDRKALANTKINRLGMERKLKPILHGQKHELQKQHV